MTEDTHEHGPEGSAGCIRCLRDNKIVRLRGRILYLLKAADIGPDGDTCLALLSLSAMCLGEEPSPHDVAKFIETAGMFASDGRARVEVVKIGPMEPGGEGN